MVVASVPTCRSKEVRRQIVQPNFGHDAESEAAMQTKTSRVQQVPFSERAIFGPLKIVEASAKRQPRTRKLRSSLSPPARPSGVMVVASVPTCRSKEVRRQIVQPNFGHDAESEAAMQTKRRVYSKCRFQRGRSFFNDFTKSYTRLEWPIIALGALFGKLW